MIVLNLKEHFDVNQIKTLIETGEIKVDKDEDLLSQLYHYILSNHDNTLCELRFLCHGCGELKLIYFFGKNRNSKFGLFQRCKDCFDLNLPEDERKAKKLRRLLKFKLNQRRDLAWERVKSQQEKIKRRRKSQKKYRDNNKEKIRASAKEYRERNKDKNRRRKREDLRKQRENLTDRYIVNKIYRMAHKHGVNLTRDEILKSDGLIQSIRNNEILKRKLKKDE